VPWNVDNALYVIGWLLLVLGIILAVLSFLGHPIGPGIGRERAGRRWYY
jgi:hypothetical protein